jgi:hypothetical protein
VSYRISNSHINIAGVALFSVATTVSQTQRGLAVEAMHRRSNPDLLVESLNSAVNMVHAIILRQLIDFSVQLKSGSGYTPRHASYNCAHIGWTDEVGVEVVKTKNYITQLSLRVRNHQPRHRPPIRNGLEHHSATAKECPGLYRTTIR